MQQTDQTIHSLGSGAPQQSGPEPARELLARIRGWQRASLVVAAVGAATIVACAYESSRPLPVVGPPPAGVAPLLLNAPAAAGAAPAAAPAAISGAAYLALLKQIDQQRIALLGSFDSALAGTGQPAQPVAQTLVQSARSLLSTFQAQPAPVDCSNLAAVYSKLLQDQCGMLSQAAPFLQSGDHASAAALQSGAQKQIDGDAAAADASLAQTAATEQSPKPFTIAAAAPGSGQNPPAADPAGSAAQTTPQMQTEAPERANNQYAPASTPPPGQPNVPQQPSGSAPVLPASNSAAPAAPTPAP